MSEEKSTAVTVVKEQDKQPKLVLADVIRTPEHARALKDLLTMMKSCRPHDTKSTLDFAKKWLKPLGAKMDARGNWLLVVGDSKVVWSSHIDTVDWREGPKLTVLNPTTGVLSLSDKSSNASCLGADCTTGVWIMREMAMAKVPGLYIWHEAEESGGQGSSHIANKTPEVLKGKVAAIAFDRKGFADIITEQAGGQCCSDEFAKALALQLPLTGFKPDPTGSFTDTANYTDLIPECTNLSVGYHSQHGKYETQNCIFAMMLRSAMLRFDEGKLVIKRKPGEGKRTYGSLYGGSYGGRYMDWGWDDHPSYSHSTQSKTYDSIVLVGNRVRILSTAVGRGALETDIGRVGTVTLVTYPPGDGKKAINIMFDDGDRIEKLPATCVEKVLKENVSKEKKFFPYWLVGDRVRVSDTSKYVHSRKMQGKVVGTTVLSKGGTELDIKLDNGTFLFAIPEDQVHLIGTAPKKVKPSTRCGGLCEGSCKGYCKDPVAKQKAIEERKAKKEKGDLPPAPRKVRVIDCTGEADRRAHSIRDFVDLNPDAIADLIEGWGMTIHDLYAAYPDSL